MLDPIRGKVTDEPTQQSSNAYCFSSSAEQHTHRRSSQASAAQFVSPSILKCFWIN